MAFLGSCMQQELAVRLLRGVQELRLVRSPASQACMLGLSTRHVPCNFLQGWDGLPAEHAPGCCSMLHTLCPCVTKLDPGTRTDTAVHCLRSWQVRGSHMLWGMAAGACGPNSLLHCCLLPPPLLLAGAAVPQAA